MTALAIVLWSALIAAEAYMIKNRSKTTEKTTTDDSDDWMTVAKEIDT